MRCNVDMFKAKLSDPSILKDSIDTISQLIHEGIFEIDSESLSFRAADRATVTVVDFELDSSAFDEYECDEEHEIGINLEKFLEVLKRAKSDNELALELSDDESKLKVMISNVSERRFELPLLSVSRGEIPNTTKLEFSADLNLKSSLIKKGISDADIVSDSIVFKAEEGVFTMETSSDSSSVEIKTDSESDDIVDMEVDEEVRSRYPLDYLKKITKASKISEVASLRFDEDYPMKMEYKRPEEVRLTFVVAPRVEE